MELFEFWAFKINKSSKQFVVDYFFVMRWYLHNPYNTNGKIWNQSWHISLPNRACIMFVCHFSDKRNISGKNENKLTP